MCIYKHPDQRHHPRFCTCSATMHGACMHHMQCITIISKNSISSIRFHLHTMSCIIILMTTTLVWCWLASCAQPPFHHHHHDHQSQDHHQHMGDPWQVVGSLQTLLLTSWLFIIIMLTSWLFIHYYHHQCNGHHHHHHHHHKGHRHPLSTSLNGDYYMQLLRTLYFIPYKHMMSYHLQVGYDSSRNDSFLEGWLTEHAFITIENLSHCMQSLLQTHLGFYMIWAYGVNNQLVTS